MIVLLHLCTPFVGTNADEQNLSMKATVICQGEKRSPSEKHLHKGTLQNIRNMCNMSIRAIHCFLCRKVWDIYFNLGLMIIPCGDV